MPMPTSEILDPSLGEEFLEEPLESPIEAGGDTPIAPFDMMSVTSYIKMCRDESEEARQNREAHNRINYDAYHCRVDTSNKLEGQSVEFLPKTAMAIEQLAAFIKRGLLSYGNYFSVELTPDPAVVGGPLTEGGIVNLLRHRLESPSELPNGVLDFPTLIADGVKTGGLGALVVLKVGGMFETVRRLTVDTKPVTQVLMDPLTGVTFEGVVGQEEELVMREGKVWRLVVELIRPEDYYPDPTGRGLYEIHRTYKDLYEVIDMAESGEYDADAVAQLSDSFSNSEVDSDTSRETNQNIPITTDYRKQVEILEFWGTILDSSGNVVHRNCRATIANDEYVLRQPEPNPYWHQERPFVVAPLLRVPFSVFHKALFDHAVRLNLAMNELFNLIVDGAIGAVWGVREVQLDLIENAEDFSDGIPQGATIFKKAEAQQGVPVMNMTPGGVVPQEAMATFQLLDREFASASMLSDTARGMIPRKDVSATAIASVDQSTSAFFDSIIADLEASVIRPALRLSWLTMLQNADDWNAADVAGCIGPSVAKFIGEMSPARRYLTYAQGCTFKVSGLSSMVARVREFQKIMSALTAITQSPILTQVAYSKMSPEKLLFHILRCLNIDPDDMRMTEDEQATLEERMKNLPFFAQLTRGGTGGDQAQFQPEQQPGNATQQVQAQIASQNTVPQGL